MNRLSPQAISKQSPIKEEFPSLAVVLICKNEEKNLPRCLSSVAGQVNEIVVLDTGSTDKTMEIAKSFGAFVYQTIWKDSFSLARNEALDLSTCDFNLVLDADEWVSEHADWSGLRRHLKEVREMASMTMVPIQNFYRATGKPDGEVFDATSWMPRLLSKEIRYVGSIHEQPYGTNRIFKFALPISHDGYLYSQERGRSKRNLALLVKALELDPDNAYYLYQIGKEHEAQDAHELALGFYAKALQGCSAQYPFHHSLVCRAIYCAKAVRNFDFARDLIDAQEFNYRDSADFYFCMGDFYLDYAIHAPASEQERFAFLPLIRASFVRCLQIGENPHLEGAVRGRGSFLAQKNLSLFDSLFSQTNPA
jgi:glycosyltransferase involved in cell wall biosynthesis